ncbi:MAG: hypothetical protein Q9177_005697 [Variospora cf. flavescens]
MTTPLIRSATKRQFLISLGLDPDHGSTQETYWMLKDEATRAYESQLQGRGDLLRPEYANQEPPFAAAHFTAEAFSSVVRSIYQTACPSARRYYDRGRVVQGDNWVISWMLYHVCRYRDGRNIRAARARDFHADDDLDDNHGREIASILIERIEQPRLTSVTGGSNLATTAAAARPGKFYDAARNGYR